MKRKVIFEEQGISLIITLTALIILSLAAIGLVRLMDSGTMAVGNIAFKQAATQVTDSGAEQAIAWLDANKNTPILFESDKPTEGYYASYIPNLDPTDASSSSNRVAVDWKGTGCSGSFSTCITPKTGVSVNGQAIKYIITRLCKTTGAVDATGNNCVKVSGAQDSSSDNGEQKYGEQTITGVNSSPNFRVIVYVAGARQTVSMSETVLHF